MWLTYKKYKKRIEELNSNYWREGAEYRWEYMSWVIDKARDLNAVNIIEAGVSRMPLNDSSVAVDYPAFDLNKTPYPYADNEFDCFIALQVWEHLDKQVEAFREAYRISKAVILSFPYKWTHSDKRHNNIDESVIERWTAGVKPAEINRIKNRIIYVWRKS